MHNIITKAVFEENLREKLGANFERALTVFTKYGDLFSWDVTNVLLHAADRNKVAEVLAELEKHWEDHLQFLHPAMRANTVNVLLGGNDTEIMFLQTLKNILQVQPA